MSGLYIPAHTGPQPPTGHHRDIVTENCLELFRFQMWGQLLESCDKKIDMRISV